MSSRDPALARLSATGRDPALARLSATGRDPALARLSATGFIPHTVEVVAAGAAPSRAALVVHGILGSGANWRSFVRHLVATSAAASAFRWVLVDLRHHGESTRVTPPPEPPDTVAACADDCRRLADRLGIRWSIAIGHSFGGKVVADLVSPAQAGDPGQLPSQAWLLDSPPGPAPHRTGDRDDELARVIAAVRSLGATLPGRAEVAAHLAARGLSTGLAQWMTTNVRGDEAGGYQWKFSLAGAEALIQDYLARDDWSVVETPPPGVDVRVVVGGRSDRWTDADRERLRAARGTRFDVIADAGHWLHVDAPNALMALLAAGLPPADPVSPTRADTP